MTIHEIQRALPTRGAAVSFVEGVYWPSGPRCPYCSNQSSTPVPRELRHHCNVCNTTFAVTAGTFMHKTRLDLRQWLAACVLVLSGARYVSVRALAREVGVNRNTAGRMIKRLRWALLHDRDRLYEVLAAVSALLHEHEQDDE